MPKAKKCNSKSPNFFAAFFFFSEKKRAASIRKKAGEERQSRALLLVQLYRPRNGNENEEMGIEGH